MLPQEWNIQSRALACAASGLPFQKGDKVYSALYWRNNQYERIDLTASAWEARNENVAPLSAWQTDFLPPPPAPSEALNKNDAESLLRHLMKEGDPSTLRTRYILALMLERKKLLRQIERQRAGSNLAVLVYEHLPSGEVWLIEDPGVKLSELASLQNEVASRLAMNEGASAASSDTSPASI